MPRGTDTVPGAAHEVSSPGERRSDLLPDDRDEVPGGADLNRLPAQVHILSSSVDECWLQEVKAATSPNG